MAGVLICQHVKRDGVRCGSPAIRGKRYCFHHQRERGVERKWRRERERQRWFERAALDDRKAVQRALWDVMDRLLNRKIGKKRAYEIVERLRGAIEKLQHADVENEAGSSPALRARSE
jgi:hypothetical protein